MYCKVFCPGVAKPYNPTRWLLAGMRCETGATTLFSLPSTRSQRKEGSLSEIPRAAVGTGSSQDDHKSVDLLQVVRYNDGKYPSVPR